MIFELVDNLMMYMLFNFHVDILMLLEIQTCKVAEDNSPNYIVMDKVTHRGAPPLKTVK